MAELPTGTVTFLFTDIEGSTRLLKQLGLRYDTVLAEHQRILRECFDAHAGREVDTQGDSFFAAFARAGDAVACAMGAQRALAQHAWPNGADVRVRMGLHTGEPRPSGARYVGFGVHRAARIGAVGHGGQILLSNATRELVEDELPADTRVRELGAFELKDLERPERLFQLEVEGLASEFPPLKARKVVEPRRISRPVVLGALIVLLVAGAAAIGAARWMGGSDGNAVDRSAAGGEAVAVDATTGSIARRIAAGRTPSAIAAGEDAVWLVDADARTLLRIVPSSGVVETLATGATPTDVAVGADGIWVANGRRLPTAQFVGPVATAVARLDPATRTERSTTALPRPGGAVSNIVDNHVTTSAGAAWAITPDFGVVRIDATTGGVTATTRVVPAAAIAAGRAGVWVVGTDGRFIRLDPRTAKPVREGSIPADEIGAIAVGDEAAWVTSPRDGRLWRIGAGRGQPQSLGATQLSPGVGDVAVGAAGVWVANPMAGTLTQVDPKTTRVVRTIELDGIPRSIAVVDDLVWVALAHGATISETSEIAGITTFQQTTCERPLAGSDGTADVLVTSDLPLQGGTRISAAQMAQAIAFVLRERGFRAGDHRVAYQSCDDSVASTGLYEPAKCAANARAYARNPDVVGVIGTMNSACAVAAVPELNRADGGPLPMVSPFNGFVGLTRQGPGVDPTLPAALYPTGTRNYFRVYPTDDLEAAALALFAQHLGRNRVFVLDDGDPGYGALQATAFETAARRLGLDVTGRESWDPLSASYRELVRRVAASGARAVFVGGLIDTNAAQVIRDLRGRMGRRVALMGPSGLTGIPLLVKKAGTSAVGVYVSFPGVLAEALPAGGARWVKRFGATQRGVPVEPSAVYAAQAAEVLLDAVGRSDGTRASVLEELSRTNVRDGLLGSFGFDANGDISESPVTIVRVSRPGASNTIMSVEGATIARVERPSPRLVAIDE